MAIKEIKEKNLTWVNIDEVNDEAIAYLKTNYNFHHLDLEDIKGVNETPKLDVYKNYLFLVLQVPEWNDATKTVESQEIDFFIGQDFIVSVEHGTSKELKKFFFRCLKHRRHKREWMSGSSGYLLYQIVDSLIHSAHPILNNIGREIGLLEHEVYTSEPDARTTRELSLHRRNVLHFRRIIDPERFVIANLSHIRKPFLAEETSLYFDDVHDYLNKLWAIVDTYKDTINGLHITVESLVNQRTTKVVSTLTVISAGLLPLTLLSGIYGMNIDNLAFANDPRWVWCMFIILAVVIIGGIGILKKRRWL